MTVTSPWRRGPYGPYGNLATTGYTGAAPPTPYQNSDQLIMPRGAQAAAFTPLTLTPTVYLDSGISASLTDAGSGHCSQWADQSGNALHQLQGSDAVRPIIGTDGTTGLSMLTNSATQFMSCADSNLLDFTDNISIFVALKCLTVSSFGILLSKDGATQAGAYGLDFDSATTTLRARVNGTTATILTGSTLTGRHIIGFTYDKVAGFITPYFDGVAGTQAAMSVTAANTAVGLSLMRVDNTFGITANWFGVFMKGTTLTAPQIASLHAYWKARFATT